MIRYTLRCEQGHDFESWFPSSDSYEAQRGRGLVSCPNCGSVRVEKAIMAPSVARTDRGAPPAAPDAAPAQTGDEAPGQAPAQAPANAVALMGEQEREFRRLVRELRDHVTRNADYVGEDFATLARKMHGGEIEHRSIYGEASAEEVKALRDDEVAVFPLPVLPEDRN
ncbi:DUF1178 family protein [Roseixanthobacter glucoisosaccharinicivorans]|uniref:DUF1178 family protein n=1 Tax=Roseixanthobacter glucoisosaccharinicivorans TaxID=3119923 RepID=UPI00372674F4